MPNVGGCQVYAISFRGGTYMLLILKLARFIQLLHLETIDRASFVISSGPTRVIVTLPTDSVFGVLETILTRKARLK